MHACIPTMVEVVAFKHGDTVCEIAASSSRYCAAGPRTSMEAGIASTEVHRRTSTYYAPSTSMKVEAGCHGS